MDMTFLMASLLGIALTITSYASPKAVFLRDGLGKGDRGNRLLLIMIPGLSIMCLGVTIFELCSTYATGLSPWRVWGIPLAALLATFGLGVALWSAIPGPVPLWLQPQWMKEEAISGALSSLSRVRQAQDRHNRRVAHRGFEYFQTQVIDGISLAYPQNWVLEMSQDSLAASAGVRLELRFSVDTPHDYQPRARFLVSSVTSGELANAPALLRRLIIPPGWRILEVKGDTLSGYPALYASSAQSGTVGVQQRWATVIGDTAWMVAFQVAAPNYGSLADVGKKIAATLVFPSAPPAAPDSDFTRLPQ